MDVFQEYKEFAANTGLGPASSVGALASTTARTNDTLEDELMFGQVAQTSLGNSGSHANNKDERQKAHIRQLEKKKQDEMDLLKTQVKTLESENTKLQQSFDSSKARNKTLSNESKSLKNQISLLKEKSGHDDELVTALMSQIDVLKEDLQRAVDAEKEASQMVPSSKMTAAQEQVEKAIIEQLKHLVSEKESKIKELEMQLLTATVQSKNEAATPTGLRGGGSALSLSSVSRPGSTGIPRRPDSSSLNHSTPVPVSHTEVRLQELSTLLSATSVEKEKLREFCTMLQKRVDESVELKVKLEKELSHHKKRSVLLEKQLGAASVHSSVSTSTTILPTAASKARNVTGANPSLTNSSISLRESNANGFSVPAMEEASTKVELLQEEIVSLKCNLQSIMKARDEDFLLYKNMIEETKNVFLTALRQVKLSADEDSSNR